MRRMGCLADAGASASCAQRAAGAGLGAGLGAIDTLVSRALMGVDASSPLAGGSAGAAASILLAADPAAGAGGPLIRAASSCRVKRLACMEQLHRQMMRTVQLRHQGLRRRNHRRGSSRPRLLRAPRAPRDLCNVAQTRLASRRAHCYFFRRGAARGHPFSCCAWHEHPWRPCVLW